MKPLYTQKDFDTAKSRDKLACECYICQKPFYKIKYDIQKSIKSNKTNTIKYCSSNCRKTKEIVNCTHCNNKTTKFVYELKKNKNHFCSKSCCVSYNNKNKITGSNRSKLEIWLESKLTSLYPNLEIYFNRKNIIGSELDIYIPKFNLAIELNGIFHYEPIYGIDKLNQTKLNDISKTKACHDAKINLCIIDTSQQKYFKETTSQKYLDIITNIIDNY